MSSYANKKSRVFMQPGSTKVIQKRSESRLKNIKSAVDNRAWTDCIEDRRQYILELIKSKAGGLSLGKYIPIEVIIDCLLAAKNAQIAELQRQLDAYKKLKLTDEQKRQMGLAVPETKLPEPVKVEPPKPEPPKEEPPKIEPAKVEPPEPEPPKEEPPKEEPSIVEPSRDEPPPAELPEEKPSEVESTTEPASERVPEILDDKAGVPLKSAYQKIVVGDVNLDDLDVSTIPPESPAETEDEFEDIEPESPVEAEVEKGELEAMSHKEEPPAEGNLEDLSELAEKAVNQLEKIKEVIDQCGLDMGGACPQSCHPCPLLAKTKNDLENRAQQLESLMKERDDLLVKVSTLMNELNEFKKNGSRSINEKISIPFIDQLQKRFSEMIGLEEDVQSLVDLIMCKDNALIMCKKELEKCRKAVVQLEKELENCALLNAENEKLKMKLQELSNLEKKHGEILGKLDAMEEQLQSKCRYTCQIEKESAMLRQQVENDKCLKRENEMLKRQVGDLECCIADLEEEIKRLVGHIDRLTEGTDEQQAKMQNAMSNIRAELEEKTLLIQKSEEKLATVQQKLEVSIKGVSSETNCFRNKIEDLQKLVSLKEEEISILNHNLQMKDQMIIELNGGKKPNEDTSEMAVIKNLKQELANSIRQNEKLQGQLEKIVMSKKNETCLHKMLAQSAAAIRKVKEEISRQYKEWEEGAGEQGSYMDRIKILEEEVSNMKDINIELRESFQSQRKCNCLADLENKALKKHSTEIQNIAKCQVQDLCDHLKKAQMRIIDLEELLEEQKKVNSRQDYPNGEGSCLCDMDELERLTRENEILKKELLKEQDSLKKVESSIDQDLLNEIQRLKNEVASLESDKLKLEKENENLKTKSQFRDENSEEDNKLKQDIKSSADLNENLKNQIGNLERELSRCRENEKNLRELNETMKNQIENLRTELSAKTQTNNEKEKPDDLKNENIKLKQEIDALNNTLAELNNIKKQLAECLEKEKMNVGEKGNENDALKNTLATMEDMKKQLAECMEKEKNAKIAKENENSELKRENDSLKSSLQELNKIRNELDECLKREKGTKGEKENENLKLRSENDDLKKSLQELNKIKDELAECLKREKSASQQQLNSSNDMSNEIAQLKTENDSLRNSMEAMKKELEACLQKDENDKNDVENANLKEKLKQLEIELSECMQRKGNDEYIGDSPKDLHTEIHRLLRLLEKEKNDCKETIKSLKDQYDRDVKNLQTTNRLSIDKLQEQHSNQIKELESLHDSLVSSLKDDLKNSQIIIEEPSVKSSIEKKKALSAQNFCICCEMPRIVPIITTLGADIAVHEVDSHGQEAWPKPRLPKDSAINRVLFKALHHGMESLSMEELKMIHGELVRTTAKVKEKIPRSMTKLLDTQDPVLLMDKIDQLEDNLQKKQKSAKQKVIALHMSIRSVERRISEMKYVLDKEREHNAQLRAKLLSLEKSPTRVEKIGGCIEKTREDDAPRCMACRIDRGRKQDLDRCKKRMKKSRGSSISSISTESSEQKGKKRSISTPPSTATRRYCSAEAGRKDKGNRTKKGTSCKHCSEAESKR